MSLIQTKFKIKQLIIKFINNNNLNNKLINK